LIITGHPTDPLARQALDAGAKGLLKKPFEIGKVLEHLSG
jgi:FixJ family two-component response regulator